MRTKAITKERGGVREREGSLQCPQFLMRIGGAKKCVSEVLGTFDPPFRAFSMDVCPWALTFVYFFKKAFDKRTDESKASLSGMGWG